MLGGVWWMGFVGLQPGWRCPGFPCHTVIQLTSVLPSPTEKNSLDTELIALAKKLFQRQAGCEAPWQGKAGFGSLPVPPCHSPLGAGICAGPFSSLTRRD